MTTPKTSKETIGDYTEVDDILELLEEIEAEEADSFVVDMTDTTNIRTGALRVELRRTREPAASIHKVPHSQRLPDENCIIGIIDEEDLPQEGEMFSMPFHMYNSYSDFGNVNTKEPVTDLYYEEGCYYFTTSEGQWRLKILDCGN